MFKTFLRAWNFPLSSSYCTLKWDLLAMGSVINTWGCIILRAKNAYTHILFLYIYISYSIYLAPYRYIYVLYVVIYLFLEPLHSTYHISSLSLCLLPSVLPRPNFVVSGQLVSLGLGDFLRRIRGPDVTMSAGNLGASSSSESLKEDLYLNIIIHIIINLYLLIFN